MTATSLPGLPTEILLDIQSSLSHGSRLALKLTCLDLYFKLDNLNQTTDDMLSGETTYSMTDLLEVELWPEYNAARHRTNESKQPISRLDYFACHLCLKIRCASQLSNAMMKSKRGKLGNGATADKVGCFCLPCGLSHGIYQRGVCLQLGGKFGGYGFVCRKCGDSSQVEFSYEIEMAQRICTSC